MKSPYSILMRPILTEKMLKQQENLGKYAFIVEKEATKIDIKRAVEKRFDVSVVNVRTINVFGKMKRMNTRRGITRGRRPSCKKAIITLRKGDTIDLFGGAKA